MNQFVHWNQLLAHALSFVVFYFLVRMAFAAIIYPMTLVARYVENYYEKIK
jgi:hypothetical protein